MKKISWFKRLFMSWNSLENYFNHNQQRQTVEEIKNIYEKMLQDKNKWLDQITKDKELSIKKISELEHKLMSADHLNQTNEEKNANNFKQIAGLNQQISELKTELNEKRNHQTQLKTEIYNRLNTLGRIERTFFAATGNKGKAKLGEMHVKTILEKSGLTKDMWVENLQVNTKVVEFAIKSADDGKWIPVDSKVLDTEKDDDGKIIIDKKYTLKVRTQAKEVAKYLSKKNTAGYGILVLQSDPIYMGLYDEFPEFFQKILQEYKIHIASPSSFVQAAWNISQIVDIYERVKDHEGIYQDMISALNTVAALGNALVKAHKDFNVAMNHHYPSLKNKQELLAKKLVKSGAIKNMKGIGEN